MAIVRNLIIRAGADFSSMQREMRNAQNSLGAFKKSASIAVKGIAAALATIGVGGAIKDAVNDAMKFEASLMIINRQMNNSAKEFVNWAKTSATAFNMSRSEAVRFGATYSNLITTFVSDGATISKYTQDLLKASSVTASATGRSMEDVMERIRSGMLGNTEAIEDLGINIYVSLLESTKAFERFANGKSWDQLSFQTQQQIRYFAILEQVANKFGTEVYDNTASRQTQFIAQLKDVRLYLGQAFLPIYNYILPALTRFASALATVMNFIAQFTTALFGGTVKSQNAQAQATNAQAGAVAGLGDAYKNAGNEAKKAGKKAKGSLASFDQLNVVGGKDSSSDSGGGASADIGDIGASIPDAGVFGSLTDGMIDVSQKAQDMANKVREVFDQTFNTVKTNWGKAMSALYPSLQQAWSQIQPELVKWKDQFKKMFDDVKTLGAPLGEWFKTGFIKNVQEGIELFGHVWAGLLDSIRTVVSSIWEAAFPILDKFVTEGLPRISEFMTGANEIFKSLFDLVKKIFDDIWRDAVDPALKLVSKIIMDAMDIVYKWWDDWGKKIVDGIKKALDNIKGLWENLWNNFLKPFVSNMLEMLSWLWDKHLKGLVEELTKFIGKLVDGALEIFNKFIIPIVNYLVEKLGPTFSDIFSFIGDIIGTALGVISDVAKGIIKSLGGVIDFIVGVFTGDWKKAWNGIQDFMDGMGDSLVGIFKGAINLIIDAFNFMIRQINKIKIDIPDWVPGDMGGKSFGLTVPTIPKLAKGGLAYGPTLAMVGDNRGAASNPEVIAPLNKLESIMSNSGDPQVVNVLNQIYGAIKSGQNVNVTISQTAVANAAISGIKDHQRRTGALPFPV